ncbi:HD-GYP domain-containing protein [Rubinisphaera margarita]|uniref:HD-GYP domain-containing protein n=1 Tax=Rubinisphaera margarita TaxID=2909586 RepID=UPI001EE87B9F|nr:HD domain-containing phosphohydrolase [Rubinisphaera margarita]MCG6158451.1 HD domain-containing protein [Rubinisphaera margarita]
MTTTATTEQPDVAEPAPDENGSTVVPLTELIVGRTVRQPIYDLNGILLLAENTVITSEMKLAIRKRGANKVRVSNQDLKRITLDRKLAEVSAPKVSFDQDLTRKLDAIVDGGLLSIKNTGPAVKNDVVFLGRKGYNQEQRQQLIDDHQKNGQALGDMLSEALRGETMDGSLVSTMAAHYLKEMTTDTDNVLTSAINQFSNDNIAANSLEVALLAMAIGIEMDLDAENSRHLAMAGIVHDWGMMRVPASIRLSAERLDAVEMLEIKKHPIHSLELLQRVSALPRVVSVISYQVHERLNGTGYPRGRRGQSIHPFARILQVADAFVGMTSPRPYRPPLTRYAAMECLLRQARERFVDPEVVRCMLKIQSLFPIGSFVLLSDDTVAQVMRRNLDHYTQPIVARVSDANGELVDRDADENKIDLHADESITVVRALPTPGSDEIDSVEEFLHSNLDQAPLPQ